MSESPYNVLPDYICCCFFVITFITENLRYSRFSFTSFCLGTLMLANRLVPPNCAANVCRQRSSKVYILLPVLFIIKINFYSGLKVVLLKLADHSLICPYQRYDLNGKWGEGGVGGQEQWLGVFSGTKAIKGNLYWGVDGEAIANDVDDYADADADDRLPKWWLMTAALFRPISLSL